MTATTQPYSFIEVQRQLDQEIDAEISKVKALIAAMPSSVSSHNVQSYNNFLTELEKLKAENAANTVKYTP